MMLSETPAFLFAHPDAIREHPKQLRRFARIGHVEQLRQSSGEVVPENASPVEVHVILHLVQNQTIKLTPCTQCYYLSMKSELSKLAKKNFPPLLDEIPGKPKQLYVRGDLPPYDWKWLAVVGSRAITPYGKQVCRYLLEGLRGYPIVIVSGLAYGADAEAHKTALEIGLPTVAVPGSGLDYSVMYPRANVALAKEIIRRGGAHLSEFDPETTATDYTFPQRNRIMAGMSHATLVIEAKERSGSLITARLATEYNRELLVVPGSIFSATSKGNHQFLKLGAYAVTESDDILKALGLDVRLTKLNIAERGDLSENERKVFEIIANPCPRDDLIGALDLPITETNILLSTMEIKGLIKEELGVIRIA